MNYRRNEDKWPYLDKPIFTGLLSDPTFDETDAVEPVSLAEAKRHLRVTSTDDDALISDLIGAAREKVESRHNKSLVRRIVKAVISNGNGRVDLPYGPIISVEYTNDKDGGSVDYIIEHDIETPGGAWLSSPISDHLQVVYTAGFTPTTIPKKLKREILEEIAYMYRHAGDEKRENGSSKSWIV